MQNFNISWSGAGGLNSRRYVCGYCNTLLASDKGYQGIHSYSVQRMPAAEPCYIYVCHVCNGPTFFFKNSQYPGARFGDDVDSLATEIESLYDEARQCISVNAFTASVMCSRKLLMNIAVSKGAALGLSYKQYVDYLADNHYVPPGGEAWVDHIRQKGNEANHEISVMSKKDAEELITFLEMTLKFIYEFPARLAKKTE